MNNHKVKRVIAGIVFFSTLAIANYSYADADTFQLETEIKKLQNEIKSLQQTQIQMKLELDKLNQDRLSYESYNVATTKKPGSRGQR